MSKVLVKKTAEGCWLIHEQGQPPIEGTAVYRYSHGISGLGQHPVWYCEECDRRKSEAIITMPYCWHMAKVKSFEKQGLS